MAVKPSRVMVSDQSARKVPATILLRLGRQLLFRDDYPDDTWQVSLEDTYGDGQAYVLTVCCDGDFLIIRTARIRKKQKKQVRS